MLNPVEQVTVDLVKLAVKACVMQHKVIATNVANVNTPGFQPIKLSFDEQLQSARSSLLNMGDPMAAEQVIESLQPVIVADTVTDPLGNPTATIDKQMVLLTENSLQYQALLEGLSKKGQLMHMALKGDMG